MNTKLSEYVHGDLPSTFMNFKDDAVLQGFSQEPSMSTKYPNQGQGVLDTHLIMLECTQVGNPISRTLMGSRMTYVIHVSSLQPSMSSKSPIMTWDS